MRWSVLILLLTGCARVGDVAPWSVKDEFAPTVLGTCPSDGETGVSLDVRPKIFLDFCDESGFDLDIYSVKSSRFSLTAAPGRGIGLDVFVDEEHWTIIIEPRQELMPFVDHTLVLLPGIRDEHGNRLQGLTTVNFTTGDGLGRTCRDRTP